MKYNYFEMVAIKLQLLLLLHIFYVSDCVRRIQGGQEVKSGKGYMVYLVKAQQSIKQYDEWLCGGALVSTLFILTSAACIEDVEHMYAIAGTNKYIPDHEIDNNPCTKEKKKKVVYACFPLNYEYSENVEKWSYIDIGLAKVESPYDLQDETYNQFCSYKPNVISINFESRFDQPGSDAIVLGWGHANEWRLPEDETKYNQDVLHYASVKIMEKEPCKAEYVNFTGMGAIIDEYMICTVEEGQLDDSGHMLQFDTDKSPERLDGCNQFHYLSLHDILADDENPLVEDKTRRDCLRSYQMSNDSSTVKENRTHPNSTRRTSTRGICQNDHGGPLVGWVGAEEVLLGVASVFRVDGETNSCVGPYLYTDTACTSAFLDCVLSEASKTRRSICDSPPTARGYDIIEKHIWWNDSPAKAAINITLSDVNVTTTSTTTATTTTTKTTKTTKRYEHRGIIEKFWTKFRKQGL